MTRKRSSPMGLEIYLPVLLAFIMLPLLAQAAPLQDYTEIQQYTEGCYYNYNHYNEGDRIMTNEPCLNCTCHNKMLMCYLRVCPFTKPIGHDCIVEKREDQCCPITTCPEVPVDVAHTAPEPGTELSFPEKFGCSIEGKFYLEGAQVPSNPNKPCELCYCIKNRTSCLMQECTLHIDGCTPIYNKGSCCPVRYNCDHENDVLELEDHSSTTEAATTTTTERPSTGFIISSTTTAAFSADCIHNGEVYADGARIPGETACEKCYCMRGDIVCAVQECHMPMLDSNGKLCQPLPAAEGECCPSNYVCKDDTATTQIIQATTLPYSDSDEEVKITTAAPVKDLHSAIPEEDLQLQTHIDDEQAVTKAPPTQVETEEKTTEAAIASKPAATDSQTKQEDAELDSVTKYDEQAATNAPSTQVETEEKTTEAAIASKPGTTDSQNKQKDAELDSVSKYDENAEETTTTSSDIKPVDSDEIITIAPTSADEITEYSTEQIDSISSTEISKITDDEHPAQGVYELSEISTVSTDIGEEYTTATSATDESEIGDSVTEVTEASVVEKQYTTELIQTEKIFEGSTESADEVKVVSDDEYITQAPTASENVTEANEKESKPLEYDESSTESGKSVTEDHVTSEEEQISTESATKLPFDIENATGKEEQSVGQQDELATVVTAKTSEEEKEQIAGEKTGDLFTKAPTNNEEQLHLASKPEEQESTEESSAATTEDPNKDLSGEEDLSTEEPKVERKPQDMEKEQQATTTVLPITSDEYEKSAESTDEKETVHSTETSTKPEMVTKVPIFADVDQISTTTAPESGEEVEEEEEESSTDRVPTETSIYVDSVTTSDDIEGSSEGLEVIKTASDDKGKPEEVTTTIHPAEMKPTFAVEFGSGDYDAEVIPVTQSEISTVGPTFESVSVISQEEEEDKATAKPISPSEEKPIDQNTSTELSEESAESEEDNKLVDLTTVKPYKSDEQIKEDKKRLEVATIRPSFTDIPSSTDDTSEEVSGEEMETVTKTPSEDELTTTSVKTEVENVSEDKIEISTMATSLDEKPPTTEEVPSDEHESKLFGETEVSSTPIIIVESEKSGPSGKGDKEQEISEEFDESEDITTQKSIEENDQEASTTAKIDSITEGKEHDHSGLPDSGDHKDEGQSKITDSPTLITEDISSFTTAAPTSQADIISEPADKIEKEQKVEPTKMQDSSLDVRGDFEKGAPTSTSKPFTGPAHVEEMPDMQLPSIIPGEGDCLVGQKTFENNSIVPASDECEVVCKCVSSIVICEHVKCDVPENVEKCILDNASSNKCCPSYICDTDALPPKTEDNAESIEGDGDEEVSHKMNTKPMSEEADTDISRITTLKPISDAVSQGVSIPEIEMPVAMTEEPMSHIKSEDEYEQQTTKAPIKTIAKEETDIFAEGNLLTTPTAVIEDTVVPQSIAPVEREEISSGKRPVDATEKEPAPEHSSSQDQPQKEFKEKSTFPHGLGESTTDPALHIPSKESEIYSTTVAPTADIYQTIQPAEETEYEGEKAKPQTPSAGAEAASSDKSFEEPETVPTTSSSDEAKETETQTDKSVSQETTEEPKVVLPIKSVGESETQTIYSVATDELTTVATPMDEISVNASTPAGETQKEIEGESTIPGKDIEFSTSSTKFEEKQPSTEEYSKDIADFTTTIAPSKDNDTENDEKEIIRTTASPSIGYFEGDVSSTTKQMSGDIKDNDIISEALDEELESTSTIGSITEDYKEDVKPTQEGIYVQDLELSTVSPKTNDEASTEHTTSAADYNLEHTVSPISDDKPKEISEEFISQDTTPVVPTSETSQHNQPETQTDIAFVSPYPEEYDEKNKENQTASVPISDEKTLVYTTPSAVSDIKTEITPDLETKIDTSSAPSIDEVYTEVAPHNITEDMSTTMSSEIEKAYENKESAEDHTTDVSVEQQTESGEAVGSEETTETAGATIEKVAESAKGDNITIPSIQQVQDELEPSVAHTVGPSNESVTKSPIVLNKYEPEEGMDHSTTSDESTSEIIPYDKDTTPVNEDQEVSVSEAEEVHESSTVTSSMEIEIQSTQVPVKQLSLDLSEEASGESLESEEEISTKPNLIHDISESVTQLLEEATSKPTVMPVTEEDEETSGEEGEEFNEKEAATESPLAATIDEESEIFDTTEHELSTHKISEEDMASFVTKTPTSDTESFAHDPVLEEAVYDPNIIPSVTKATLIEENTEHITEQQSQEDIIPSVTEGPIPVKDIDDVTAQQPETEEEIISEHVSTESIKKDVLAVTQSPAVLEGISSEEPGIENMVHVTEAPMTSEQEYVSENATVSEAPVASEGVTDKHIEEEKGIDGSKTPDSVDEIETVTVVHPKAENEEEIGHITELPEKEDVEKSTVKTPLSPEEIQHVTYPADDDIGEDVSTATGSSISSINRDTATDQEKMEEPEVIEVTTVSLPSDETSEIVPSRIPSDNADHSIDQQTEQISAEDIDAISTTLKPMEGIEMATAKPKEKAEETSDIAKVQGTLETEATTVKLPILTDEISDITVTQEPSSEVKKESEEDEEEDNTTDQATQVPTSLQHEVSDLVTELPTTDTQYDDVSHKYITEVPLVSEVLTVKLPDVMQQATELPAKEAESEKDESREHSTNVSVLTEESTNKISEEVTELPAKYNKSDQKSHEEDTEVSVDTAASTEQLPELVENVTGLPTKDFESEKEASQEKATELPSTSHTSYNELPEHDTELPAKNIESEKETDQGVTELPAVADVSTVKLSEQNMELSTKDTHTEDEKSHEPATELPIDAHVSTDNVHEHVTELPIKDIESEEDSYEQSTKLPTEVEITTDKLPGYVTELPTQTHKDDEEIHMVTEEVKSQEHSTKLPLDIHTTSEKLSEHITELPTKTTESEVETNESADKLPEHITESPSKDGESEQNLYEESSELPFASDSKDKLPTKNVESEEESHEEATELPVMVNEVFTSGQTTEPATESAHNKEEPNKETSTEAAEDTSAISFQPETTMHPLFPHYSTLPAVDSRIDDTTSHSTPVTAKEEEAITTSTTTTVSTTTTEPVTTSAPHYQPQPPIYGQPPQYGPTQYEDEYTDEDEGEIFGPGTCRYGGKLYVSAQQIPRDDPCDFCFCFRSDIICLQQSCPPPIAGCHEEPISGFCCPRYECPVSMATVLNITTSTTTTSTTLPPHFLHHSYGNNAQRNGCLINGRSYRVGEKIESTSGPCINCTCGGDGKMKCDPQACVPEPTMQQVMAVVAAGRKR